MSIITIFSIVLNIGLILYGIRVLITLSDSFEELYDAIMKMYDKEGGPLLTDAINNIVVTGLRVLIIVVGVLWCELIVDCSMELYKIWLSV